MTPFTTRLIGFLLVALPIIGLTFLASPMLTPHPTSQRQVSVVVIDAESNPMIAVNYEYLAVQDAQGNSFDLSWSGSAVQGDHIKVWVMLPTSYEGNFASQTPYPHQYHWVRWTLFVLACIAALCLAICGLRLFFKE